MKEELRAFWHYTLGKYFYRMPPILILSVTARCNAHCQHCFYWQKTDQKKKTELSLKEIEGLSQQLGHLEALWIGGGEPFLRPDLSAIVRIFFENNQLASVSIATNGLLPARIEREVKKMVQISPKLLVIICPSIDGLEKKHDQIRRVRGAFKKVIGSYRKLRKLQRKHKNLRVRPNVTVFDVNYNNLFQLIDRAPKLFPQNYMVSLSLLRGTPRKPGLKLPSLSKLKKLFSYKNKKLKGKRGWTKRLLEKVVFAAQLKALSQKKQAVPCEAGRLLGVVFENGDLGFCELLKPIGNIRNQSFAEIWQGEKAQKMMKNIAQNKCFCTHECVLFPSLLAHPLSWLKLLSKK